jgi:hypothetical protein
MVRLARFAGFVRRFHGTIGSQRAPDGVRSAPMSRSLKSLSVALAAWCLSALVLAQVEVPRMSDPRFMGVDELSPGMTGYGLSVLRGTTPERFDIEVVDVLHQFRPDQDLILVRTTHPILDEAHVVGGMSGSPIFVNDRMIGAYAYGWPWGSRAVVGVTPIANMLREIDRVVRPGSFPGAPVLPDDRPRESRAARRRRTLGLDDYLGGAPRGALTALHEHARRLGLDPESRTPDATTLVPASTPMLVGGLHEDAVAMLASELGPFGIEVLQAGGAGEASTTPAPAFVDGGALAVTLSRGDIANNVIGTVTHVEGDRLIAFGHPMIEAGETGVPTAVARVLHVFASIQRSFKIAEPIHELGTLIEDRQAAIVVDTSALPTLVPVILRLHGLPELERSEWRFEVASHRAITPTVLSAAIQSAVKSSCGDNAWITWRAESAVTVEGLSAPVRTIDRGFASTGIHATSVLNTIRAFDVIDAAYGNPFVDSRPTGVEIDLTVSFERTAAEIVDASVSQTVVDPGEDVPVRVVLRPFEGDEVVRTYVVHVPESAAGEELHVMVQPGSDVDLERPEPRSLSDVIAAIRDRHASTTLVLSTRRSARGIRTAGHVARGLPASVLDALQSVSDSDRSRPFVTYDRRVDPVDWVLSGGARIELSVRALERDGDE